ncbi:snurportin-1 isoform X2 [Dermacentor andersoni]|uniref:snurportin-1 isoform X2 n=1 Tax=Dermacentor andersoni TaxID=34620 RepID=UPI00241759E8|nr:snurportin-1-like isoform X2 [Dermacentor andersoni]
MDGLLDSLSAGLRVTLDETSTLTPHPRFASYKLKYSASSQEARRLKFFEDQKKKRSDLFEHARRLALGSDDRGPSRNDEQMDCSVSRPRNSAPRIYKNRGSTRSYARNGYRIAVFSSLLPGGSKSSDGKHSDFCLLDCVFSEVHRTYYILDLLCWKSHPVCDSEAEFRFYWLDEKLSEVPQIKETSDDNRRCRFVTLPRYPCTTEAISALMNSPLPFEDELDGLLFYHKKAHYFEGVSPLVGWLKPYMVPEILGASVDPRYLEKQPQVHQVGLKEKLEAKKSRTRDKVKMAQSSAEDCDTEPATVMET